MALYDSRDLVPTLGPDLPDLPEQQQTQQEKDAGRLARIAAELPISRDSMIMREYVDKLSRSARAFRDTLAQDDPYIPVRGFTAGAMEAARKRATGEQIAPGNFDIPTMEFDDIASGSTAAFHERSVIAGARNVKEVEPTPEESFRRLKNLFTRTMIDVERRIPNRHNITTGEFYDVVFDEIGAQWKQAFHLGRMFLFGNEDAITAAVDAGRELAALPQDPIMEIKSTAGETASYVLTQPRAFVGTILNGAGTSAPSLGAGIGISIATGGAAIPAMVAAGLAGFATEMMFAINEQLAHENVDTTDEEAVRAALNDDGILQRVRSKSAIKGLVTSSMDAVGMGLLHRTLSPLEKAITKTRVGTAAREITNIGAQTVGQGAVEGLGEYASQKLTRGKADMRDVVIEMIAGAGLAAPSVVLVRGPQGVRAVNQKARERKAINEAQIAMERVRGYVAEGKRNEDIASQAFAIHAAVQKTVVSQGMTEARKSVREAMGKANVGEKFYIRPEALKDAGYRVIRKLVAFSGIRHGDRSSGSPFRDTLEANEDIAIAFEDALTDGDIANFIANNAEFVKVKADELSASEANEAVSAEAALMEGRSSSVDATRPEVEERIFNELSATLSETEARLGAQVQSKIYAGIAHLASEAGGAISAMDIYDRFHAGFVSAGNKSQKLASIRDRATTIRQQTENIEEISGLDNRDARNLLTTMRELGITEDAATLSDADTEKFIAIAERAQAVERARNIIKAHEQAETAQQKDIAWKGTEGAVGEMIAFAKEKGVDINEVSAFEFSRDWADSHFVPEQETQPRVPGELGRFDRIQNTVLLFEGADIATVIHEVGHLSLDILHKLDEEGMLLAGTKANIFGFLRVKDWDGIGEEQHEAFAESFEAYLYKGEAPTKELRSLYSAISRMMVRIYEALGGHEGIKRTLGYDMSPEIKQLFDRLMVADDTAMESGVALAEPEARSIGLDPVIEDNLRERAEIEQFDQEFTGTTDLETSARFERAKNMFERMDEEMNKDGSGVEDFLNPTKIFEALQKDDWAIVATADAAKTLGVMQEKFGRDNIAVVGVSANGNAQNPRLLVLGSRPDILAAAQEAGALTMRDSRGVVRVEDGAVIEQHVGQPNVGVSAKETSGFIFTAETGTRFSWLTEKVDGVPAPEQVEETETTEETKAEPVEQDEPEIPSYTTDGPEGGSQWGKPDTLSQVRAEKPAGFPDALSQVRKRRRVPSVAVKEANAIARAAVDRMTVAEIKNPIPKGTRRIKQAERIFMDAHRRQKGDTRAEWTAARNLYIQWAKLRYALREREKILAAEKRMKHWRDMTRDHRRRIHNDFAEPVRSVLAGYGVHRADRKPDNPVGEHKVGMSELERIAVEDGWAVNTAMLPNARPYEQLSLWEARNLNDFVRQATRVATDRKTWEELAGAQMRENLMASTVRKERKDRRLESSFSLSLRDKKDWLYELLRKPENIFTDLDGGRPGTWWREVWTPFDMAQNAKTLLTEEAKEKFRDIVATFAANLGDKIHSYGGKDYTREEAIVIALNTGAEHNIEAMLNGAQDSLGWNRDFINTIVAKLTDEELDAVVAIRDFLTDTFWDKLVALEKRTRGVAPKKVDGDVYVVTRPDGSTRTLKGGYYPVLWDTLSSTGRGQGKTVQEEILDRAKAFLASSPAIAATRQGHAKDRKGSEGSGKAIQLSLSGLQMHVQDVIHDITHREAVINANRLLSNPEITEHIIRRMGVRTFNSLKDWINVVAAGDFKPSNEWLTLMRRFKSVGTAMALGLSVPSMLKQALGVGAIAAHIGPVNMLKGAAAMLDGGSFRILERLNYIWEKSPAMRERRMFFDRDIGQSMKANNWKVSGRAATAWNKMLWGGIIMMDQVVSGVAWFGAYNKALNEGKAEQEAILLADSAVRTTQGLGISTYASRIMRGEDGASILLTWFMTPMSAILNVVMDGYSRGINISKFAALRETLWTVWWAMVIPSLVQSLIFSDPPGDEDDSTTTWEYIKHYGGGLIEEGTAAIPGILPAKYLLEQIFPDEHGQRTNVHALRLLESMGVAMRTLGATALGKRDFDPVKDIPVYLTGGGFFAGMFLKGFPAVPTSQSKRTIEAYYGIMEGEMSMGEAVAWMAGARNLAR